MSNLFKYTKRVLTSVLAAAVVLTAIPSTAFGAEIIEEDNEAVVLQEDVQEEAVAEVSEDAETMDGTSGDEEEVIIEEGEDNPDKTYEDVTVYYASGDNGKTFNADTKVVTLAGDTVTELDGLDANFTFDTTDWLTDVDNGGATKYAAKIDSTYDFVAYVVPELGHELKVKASDVKVTGAWTGTATGATSTAIPDSDWKVESMGTSMTYLDGAYEWTNALKVTIKSGNWLKGYADAQGGTGTINKYLAIYIPEGKDADEIKVPFTVTVDGKTKATGYTFKAIDDHTDDNDLVASVKTTDVGDGTSAQFAGETYDVSVSINDAAGKKLVEYKRNGVAKDDDTQDGAKMKTGAASDNAFFLATETAAVNLYLSDKGVATAYEHSKKKTGTLTVAFTKKSTIPTTEFTVSSNDSSYATLKNGVVLGEGTEIKTTGSTVKVDTDKDFFFNVKAKGDQNIEKVEYYISGMTGKKEVKKLDKGRAVFVGAADSELYSKITSPTGDPSTSSYYEFDATEVEYVASTDTEVKDGKTYYSKAGSATTPEATEGLYGIPFTTDHGATAETVKGDITLYVTTSADVVYDVETYAGTGSATHTYVDIASKDANDADFIITGGVTDVHTAGSLESTAVIGKPYTFTVAPIEGRKIKSVTAKMIPNATGTTAQSVALEKGNYGQYTIAEVKGTVTITVRTEQDDVTKATVKKVVDDTSAATTAATATNQYVIREKTTGTEVTTAPGVQVATNDEAFDFVVIPEATFGIKKVEYEMGGAAKATLTPVAEKASGEKEYHIAKVTGDINITVTTADGSNAVEVTKIANKDVKFTFNNEVIKDGKSVRALTDSDFTFKVEAENGANILGVWYAYASGTQPEAGDYDAEDNTLTNGTKLTSTSGTYTISAGALTDDVNIYALTSRAESASAYTAKIKATVGNHPAVADATQITMRAGGTAMYDNSGAYTVANAVDAHAVLAASFFDKDGLNITGTGRTSYKVEKTTAKTALVNHTSGVVTNGVLVTTSVAGEGQATDTVTATLTRDAGFPQFVTYTKTLGLTVDPLSTMYDKVELNQAITCGGATTSIAADPGDTIRAELNDDTATFTLIPYQTVNGESKKLAALTDGAVDGTTTGSPAKYTDYISSASWTSDPDVPASVKTDAKPFVFTGNSNEARATITNAKEAAIGTVDVDCTLNFIDGSTYTTTKGTTNVIAESYGLCAIPTVTINGASIFNPAASSLDIDLETNGNIKTASIKWDVYEVATPKGYTTAGTDCGNLLGATTQKALDAKVDGYDIKKVDSSTVNFKLEADKNNADKVTITSGATSSVTAAKKGSATLTLKATKNGMPVVADDLDVNIAYNMPTVEVYVKNGVGIYGFNTGFENPAYLSTASVKNISGVKVSEDVDANKKTLGHHLLNVPVGTVITLPSQAAAFDPATVDPKWKLYGWDVDGTYYKIGDSAPIKATSTYILPLFAPKYDGDNGAIDVVRYDNQIATLLTADSHNLTIAVSTTEEPIEVPIAVAYHTLDVAKGPNASGAPQYATTWTYDYSSKLVLDGAGQISTTGNKISTEATLVSSANVAVKYTDADGVVYDDYAADNLGTKTIVVDSQAKTPVELKIVENETDVIKVKTGQTFAQQAVKFTINNVTKKWVDATSVKATIANTSIATVADPTGENSRDIVITGKAVGETTLTVTATLADGSSTTATAKLKVEASDLEIVATVNGEAMGNTLYFQVNKDDNSLEWDIKKGGEIVSGTVNGDWTYEIERLGEFTGTTLPEGDEEWDMVPTGTGGVSAPIDNKVTTVDTTGKKLGIGQITVTYHDSIGSNGTYKKTFPVVTYQAVTIKAPASAADALKYAVKKNGKALEVGKDAVEKLTYVKGQAKYSFDTSTYTAEWLDSENPADPYWWEAATSYSADESKKVADFGEVLTFSKADLESKVVTPVVHDPAEAGDTPLEDYPIILAPAFGSPMITISNIPDSITLSDETLSTTTAVGTDVAVVKMGVTPYDSYSTNPISVGADNYDMFMLGIGDRSMTATATSARVELDDTAHTWNPGTSTLNKSGGAKDADPDVLDKAVVATASVTTGKNRTDTFSVGKINDKTNNYKKYVGKSKINVYADGQLYKSIDLYINGEYDTGLDDTDGNPIYHYMQNGKDLVDGVVTVQGAKHYYKNSVRVDGGVIDVQGGKILINAGAQVTTVGRASYDGKYYYVGTDGFLVTGKKFNGQITTGALADNTKFYLADADGVLAQSKLEGKNYYDHNCQMAVASASAKDYEPTSDGKYYVNAAGEVAISGIFKVENKDRLFRAEGTIVKHTDTDVVAGGGKLVVDGVTYIIADDDTAKRDDVWYAPTVTWTQKFPTKWDKKDAIPTVAYTVTYTSANDGKSHTTDSIIAAVTPLSVASDATEVTFTATADLSAFFQDKAGTKKAENKTLVKTYKFPKGGESGQSGQDVDPAGDISIEGLEESYPWTGKQIKPAFKVYDNVNGRYLAQGVDFTVKYGKNKDAGQGTVTITGKGNYAKTGTAATFTIVKEAAPEDPAGQVNGFGKIAQQTYTGSPIYPETIDVKLKDKTVVTMKYNGDGTYSNSDTSSTKELLVVVTNNVNKGSAIVAATGSNGVTKTTTFKINAKSMEGANATGSLGNPFEVTISDSADYKIKNTTPEVSIKFNGDELVEGQDYTAKFDAKKGKVTVTGKNNFTKKFVQEGITVNPLDLSTCKLVAVTAYEGVKYTAVKATVLDPDGNLVPAGKYALTVTPDNDAVGSNGKLIGGKNIKVVAKANGKDSLITGETSEEDFTVAKNFGKASIKVTGSKVYTGEAIELDDDWVNTNVTVKYSGSVIKCGDDFEIVGYTNNVKKGTMTVYCAGKGEFSGTKNFKVKITAKPLGAK